jgi:hypothetical protein
MGQNRGIALALPRKLGSPSRSCPRAVLHLLMEQTQFNVGQVGRDERTEEYAPAG